jgi:hypothetical protein
MSEPAGDDGWIDVYVNADKLWEDIVRRAIAFALDGDAVIKLVRV